MARIKEQGTRIDPDQDSRSVVCLEACAFQARLRKLGELGNVKIHCGVWSLRSDKNLHRKRACIGCGFSLGSEPSPSIVSTRLFRTICGLATRMGLLVGEMGFYWGTCAPVLLKTEFAKRHGWGKQRRWNLWPFDSQGSRSSDIQ
jgi:hypothetical protein